MKFDIKKILCVMAIVVMCVAMAIPCAFAATSDVDIILNEGDSDVLMYTLDHDYYLVLPNNEPLTIKYLKDHPSYSIGFSWEYGQHYDFYLCFINYIDSSGYTIVKDVGKNDGDTVTSYEINAATFSDITEDSEYYNEPLVFKFSVDTNYSSSTIKNVTVSRPKPPAGLATILSAVGTGATTIFDMIRQTLSTMLSKPLLLLPIAVTFIAIGVVWFKRINTV